MSEFKISNVKIVAAHVARGGNVLANPTGGIAEVRKDGAGLYIIRFSERFISPPTVIVTQYFPGGGDLSNDSGNTRDNAVVVAGRL